MSCQRLNIAKSLQIFLRQAIRISSKDAPIMKSFHIFLLELNNIFKRNGLQLLVYVRLTRSVLN